MKLSHHRAFLSLVLAVSFGCAAQDSGAPTAQLLSDRIILTTGNFAIANGDIFECFYTGLTLTQDVLVSYGISMQEPGGHHMSIYYTMNARSPTHHPCDEAEMATWRQVSAAEETGSTTPLHVDGLATRIPAGAQLVLQSHYINATGPRTVNDRIDILIPQPSQIRAMGGSFVVNDDSFDIPASAHFRRTSECIVDANTNVAMLVGHMHEYGAHFRLEQVIDPTHSTVLYEHDWDPSYASHPPTNAYGLDRPLMLAAGTHLRQVCEWRNTQSAPVFFPREMCITYMITFPSPTGAMNFCTPTGTPTDQVLP